MSYKKVGSQMLNRKKAKKDLERERRIKENICIVCGGVKTDLKFQRTHFCGIFCWHEAFSKT